MTATPILDHHRVRNAPRVKPAGLPTKPDKNDEWPEIISVEAGASKRVMMATKPKETREIFVKSISAGDLRTMKKSDPFGYFSIPGVRRATLLMEDIDMSNLATSDNAMTRSSMSCPSRLQTAEANSRRQTIPRRSQLSFECHPASLLEEEQEEDLLDEDDDCDDPLVALMVELNGPNVEKIQE